MCDNCSLFRVTLSRLFSLSLLPDENSIFIEKNGKLINRLNQKGKRPLHKMLNVFLKGIITKNYDKRIDLKNNLRIIKFIEKILK